MGSKATSQRIDVGEVSLAVTEVGEGEPVVLLHGFPESAYSWRYQLPALAEAGFRAVAPNLRGYPGSDRPSEVEAYAFPKLVEDVIGLVDALGYESVHLVGHDWGGAIAATTAALSPARVRSLGLLNIGPPTTYFSELLDLSRLEQAQMAWYTLLFQFPGFAEEWCTRNDFANLRSFAFGTAAPGTFDEETLEVLLAPFREEGAMTGPLNYYRANIPPAAWLGPVPELPPIETPTLVIWGDADAYLSTGILERSRKEIQGPLTVERLPGVSHWVHQEVPEVVNRHLLAFLGKHRETVTAVP